MSRKTLGFMYLLVGILGAGGMAESGEKRVDVGINPLYESGVEGRATYGLRGVKAYPVAMYPYLDPGGVTSV